MKLSQEQKDFLVGKQYLKENETIDERISDILAVVKTYEKQYKEEGLSERLSTWIHNKYISLSTPQLANVGRKKIGNTQALPCSCNILSVNNSIDGIYSSMHEVAMLSKLGAGVGGSFLNVADGGTKIEEGFHTNPKTDWIEDIVRTSKKVSQNAVRRGYFVPFDSIESKEFWNYVERLDKNNPDKKDPLVKNNFGFILERGFWERMKTSAELQKRIITVIQIREATGKVYMLDVENCNKNTSPVYEKLGHVVNTTNICCVTGDQLVSTENGFKTVKELSDSNIPLKLFDNENTHESSAMLYRGNADVYKITLDNGMSHTITSNHDLVVRERSRKEYRQSIDTGLEVGKKVLIQTKKGLFGKRNEPGLAFLLGLFLGDGSETNNGLRLSIWENDFDLKKEIEDICDEFTSREGVIFHSNNNFKIRFVDSKHTGDSEVRRKNLHTTIFNNNGFPFKKGDIPNWILDADEETHWQLLRGLLYADGTAGDYNKGKSFGQPINLSLASIDFDLLKKIQLLTVNLGLNVKICNLRDGGAQPLPKNDGTGGYREYNTKKIYRLVLSNKNDLLKLEYNTKFLSRKGVKVENREYRDNSHKSSKIISIEPLGKQDVYCPTVDSDKHLWVCNGLITSNTEVLSPSYPDKTFACIILSLNAVFADIILKKPQIVKDAFILLDIFTQVYIDLSEGVSGLEKARKSAIEKRDIGLGTLGYHSYVQSKGWAFGGLESRFFNKRFYKYIRDIGEDTTKELAEKLGAPKMCEEAGLMRRNVSLMMVAPNKSTAFFMDASEGISPFMSNYSVEKLAGVERTFKNKELEKLLELRGRNTFEVWSSILENLGSVQHLDFLAPHEKSVFKTASEISPKDIIDLAHDRQEFIDMAQSINLFGRPNYTTQDVYDIHKYAFVEKDIKTLYYYYPQAHAALEKEGESWETCESCAD